MLECDALVVGGGFGGAYAARELERQLGHRAERVVLVTPENFLLFSPLLAEAASGTIEPRHAVVPLRPMLKKVHVITGAIDSIDVDAHTAVATDHAGVRHDLHYQALVLAPGSVPSTLPIPGLADEAVGFKTLPDAIWLRNRVLAQLEAAHDLPDDDLRRELLTFTFVGGGYAGVEALAELESLTRDALHMYPRLRAVDLRWVLIEASDTVLPNLSPRLATYTLRYLRSRGVDVMLGTRLTSCVDKLVETEGANTRAFRTGTLVWTAGQRPSPFVVSLGLPTTKEGRVITDQYLAVPDHPGVFALGDAAAVPAAEGGMSPQTAAARVPTGRGRGPQRRGVARSRRARSVRLPRPRSRSDARQTAGRRRGEGLHVHGLRRVVDGPQLPPLDDPGPRSQEPRRHRLDHRAALPPRHRAARRARKADAAPLTEVRSEVLRRPEPDERAFAVIAVRVRSEPSARVGQTEVDRIEERVWPCHAPARGRPLIPSGAAAG